MKKNRLIFYAIFAIFHIGAFLFTVMLDNNTSLLFSMVQYVPAFKYATLFGVLLIIGDFAWSWSATKEAEKEKSVLAKELNTLKAKLFDLQEAAKK